MMNLSPLLMTSSKISIKKELNFKDKPDDGTVHPPEIIFPDYVTDIPKLCRKKT